jgi:hypothetical protein
MISGEAMLLIIATSIVTSITAISMAAISTNGEIKGGILRFSFLSLRQFYSHTRQIFTVSRGEVLSVKFMCFIVLKYEQNLKIIKCQNIVLLDI